MEIINQKFIDSAITIRTEYIKNVTKINSMEQEIKLVASQLEILNDELSVIPKNSSSLEEAQKKILEKMTLIEKKGNELAELFRPINETISSLEKQEEILYESIKTSYPSLTDSDIIEQLKKHITN